MTTAPTFYKAADADPSALEGATVAILGYGNLGRSMALNLRDSGVIVVVGNRDDEYMEVARADGMTVSDVPTAVADADVVYVLLADEVIPGVWADEVAPNIKPGAAAVFGSGYVVAYGLVSPPAGVDVLLLAPRMLGEEVRASYLDGRGFFSYVSVEQDASGKATERLLALALATGTLRKGAMALSARQEAHLDLFIEQTIGPLIGAALQIAFDEGVGHGLPPEAMVLEMYMSGEMSRTFQTFAEVGLYRSATAHGLTAEFGGFVRYLEVDRAAMAATFRAVGEDIVSGGFARRLQEEMDSGYPTRQAIQAVTAGDDPLSQAESRVRSALGDQA